MNYVTPIQSKNERVKPITAEEVAFSERILIKQAQKAEFESVFREITRGNIKTNWVLLLNIKNEDGVLKTVGRMANSEMPDESKKSILLPKNNHFTSLVIKACHKKLNHAGVQHTLAE